VQSKNRRTFAEEEEQE